MKIYTILLSGSILFSGYLGYSNFWVQDKVINPVVRVLSEGGSTARDATVRELEERAPESDSKDLVIKIIEMLSPLLIPIVTNRRKRTLDDDIARVAERAGMSPAVVRGKLGLANRRKKKSAGTKRKTD